MSVDISQLRSVQPFDNLTPEQQKHCEHNILYLIHDYEGGPVIEAYWICTMCDKKMPYGHMHTLLGTPNRLGDSPARLCGRCAGEYYRQQRFRLYLDLRLWKDD